MELTILTPEDLQNLKQEIINEIRAGFLTGNWRGIRRRGLSLMRIGAPSDSSFSSLKQATPEACFLFARLSDKQPSCILHLRIFMHVVINADCHLLKTIYRQRVSKSPLVQTARWVFVTQNTILYAYGGH